MYILNSYDLVIAIIIWIKKNHMMGSSDRFTNFEVRIYNLFNKYLLKFLFQLANSEKKLLWTSKKFLFFFNCSYREKFVDKIGETNLVKTSEEFGIT